MEDRSMARSPRVIHPDGALPNGPTPETESTSYRSITLQTPRNANPNGKKLSSRECLDVDSYANMRSGGMSQRAIRSSQSSTRESMFRTVFGWTPQRDFLGFGISASSPRSSASSNSPNGANSSDSGNSAPSTSHSDNWSLRPSQLLAIWFRTIASSTLEILRQSLKQISETRPQSCPLNSTLPYTARVPGQKFLIHLYDNGCSIESTYPDEARSLRSSFTPRCGCSSRPCPVDITSRLYRLINRSRSTRIRI